MNVCARVCRAVYYHTFTGQVEEFEEQLRRTRISRTDTRIIYLYLPPEGNPWSRTILSLGRLWL